MHFAIYWFDPYVEVNPGISLMAHFSLNLQQDVPASITDAFDAWTDPVGMSEWLRPHPWVVANISLSAVPGGSFSIDMRAGAHNLPHTGYVKTLDRPTRLAFNWTSGRAGRDTLLTVTFTAVAPCLTRVWLTHDHLASAEARDNHREGWRRILENFSGIFERTSA
jgi:uncharacterized protein YndB with AHSA1/START domain